MRSHSHSRVHSRSGDDAGDWTHETALEVACALKDAGAEWLEEPFKRDYDIGGASEDVDDINTITQGQRGNIPVSQELSFYDQLLDLQQDSTQDSTERLHEMSNTQLLQMKALHHSLH